MRNDVKQLETEITKLINELSSMKVDDEQYETVVDRIQTLQKLKLETERVDIDNIKIATQESNNKAMRGLEQAKMELERQIKEADLEISKAKLDNEANENKKNRLVNVIKTGAEIGLSVGTAALYYSMYKKGLKFEETGTFCSTMVKNHLSKFKLRK